MGGKMVSKRLSIYGFISAAAVVSGALAGCGGSSSSISGTSGTVPTTGGTKTSTQTFTSGVGSTPTPQQVQVTVNGTTQTASLPAGTTIPAGANVAVIPPTAIINGLTTGPRVIGEKGAPQETIPYEVYDNGKDTGVKITSTGGFSGYFILVPGNHHLTASGPFSITGGATGLLPGKITMQTVGFGVPVLSTGIPAIPDGLNLNLPTNNSFIAHGAYATAYYDPSFAGYTGTLTIKYGATTITKSVKFALDTSSDSFAGDVFGTYNALSQHPKIPRAGLDSIEFDVAQ